MGPDPVAPGAVLRCGAGASPVSSGTALLWALVPASSLWVFRGGLLRAPPLCTAGVIACCRQSPPPAPWHWPCPRAVEPLRYVGRISYGMYLWYWPLVLVAVARHAHPPAGLSAPGRASGGDHRRGDGLGLPRRAAHPPGPAPAVVGAAGHARRRQPGRAHHVPGHGGGERRGRRVGAAADAPAGPGHRASTSRSAPAAGSAATTTTTTPAPVKVLIVGDSVAGTLGVGLGRVMSQYGVVAVNEGSPGCSVSMDQLVQVLWFTDPPGKPCVNGDPDALSRAVAGLGGRVQPRRRHLHGQERGARPGGRLDLDHLGEPAFDSYVANRFRQAINVLGSRGAHVVLLTSPFYDTGVQPSGLPWPEDDPEPRDHRQPDHRVDGRFTGRTHSAPSGPQVGTGDGDSIALDARRRGVAADGCSSGSDDVTVIDTGAWLSPGGHYCRHRRRCRRPGAETACTSPWPGASGWRSASCPSSRCWAGPTRRRRRRGRGLATSPSRRRRGTPSCPCAAS